MVLASIGKGFDKVVESVSSTPTALAAGAVGAVLGGVKGAGKGLYSGAKAGYGYGQTAGDALNQLTTLVTSVAVGVMAMQLAADAEVDFSSQAATFVVAGSTASQILGFSLITNILGPAIGSTAGAVVGAVDGLLKGAAKGTVFGAQTGFSIAQKLYSVIAFPGKSVGTIADGVVRITHSLGKRIFGAAPVLPAPPKSTFLADMCKGLSVVAAAGALAYFATLSEEARNEILQTANRVGANFVASAVSYPNQSETLQAIKVFAEHYIELMA